MAVQVHKKPRRARHWLGATACALLVALLGAVPATAAEKKPEITGLGVFELEASNGYSLLGVAVSEKKSGKGSIYILAKGAAGADVSYIAPATVTPTSIHADLQSLGTVSVDLVPSGAATKVRPSCGGKPVEYRPGTFEGTIEFHGEEGFTEAAATKTPALIQPLVEAACKGDEFREVTDPDVAGARLRVIGATRGGKVAIQVYKNRPSSRVLINATISERRGPLRISRGVQTSAPSGSFAYRSDLASAKLRPAAPFSGSASFRGSAPLKQRWSGNLTVDFPGRAAVPLAASGMKSTLIHAQLFPK